MRRIVAIVVGVALVSMTAPATTATGQSIRDQNREWILDQVEDYRPDAIVEVHSDGTVEQMPARKALEVTLDRAGDRKLATLAAGASHGTSDLVGDIWLIGFGFEDCSWHPIAPQPVSAPVLSQLWIYSGEIGYGHAAASSWTATGWTMKETVTGSGDVYFGGVADFFCVEGGFFGILFPFVDGYVTQRPVPPASP